MGDRLDSYRALGASPSRLTADNGVFDSFGELYPRAYAPGAIGSRVKEFIALAISVVKDCDDCITYHAIQLHEDGSSWDEIHETLALVLVVGGSALIPTIRRTAAFWSELDADLRRTPDA